MPFFSVHHGQDASTLFNTQCSVGALTTHLSELTGGAYTRVELVPMSFATDVANNTKLVNALSHLDPPRRVSAGGSGAAATQAGLISAALHNVPFVGLLVTPVQASVGEQLTTPIVANAAYVLLGFREAAAHRQESVGADGTEVLLRRANAAAVQPHPEMVYISGTAPSGCDVDELARLYEPPVAVKGGGEEAHPGPRQIISRSIQRDEELTAERERLAAAAAAEEGAPAGGRRKSSRRSSKINVAMSIDEEEEKKAKDVPLSAAAAALLSTHGTAAQPLVVNVNTSTVSVKAANLHNGARRHVLEDVAAVDVLWHGPKGEHAPLQLLLNEHLTQIKAKIEAAQLQIAAALEGAEHTDKKKKGKK